MLLRVVLTVLGCGVLPLLCQCSGAPGEGGAPPSLMKPVIDYPAGSLIRYRDEETAHVITLFEDGRYRFESMGIYDGTTQSREGVWRWGKTGTHNAELMLDQDKWLLSFVSPESAMATNAAWSQTRAFQFER